MRSSDLLKFVTFWFSSIIFSSNGRVLSFTSKAHYSSAHCHCSKKNAVMFTARDSSSDESNNEGASAVMAGTTTTTCGPVLPEIPSTSKRLFLVRHGEVVNPGGDRPVFYGALDVPLSLLGEKEATAAADYLAQFDLQHAFASPLARAIFGAKEVVKKQRNGDGVTLTIDKGFTELDRGSWCGKTMEEIGKEAMARFNDCDESATPEGGESFPFLKTRVLRARDDALERVAPGRASAVVSHLQVTRSMLSDAKDIPTNKMAELKIATASVTCIDFDTVTGKQTVHFESFKPDAGLSTSKDGAN